jgi:hypothetical protein
MAVRRLGALALVAGLLAGCQMSLQDLRQQPPARTATFADRQYDVLAGCVAEGLQMGQQGALFSTSHLVYTVTIRPDQRRATITGYRSDTMMPNLDVILVQHDRSVSVETRMGDLIGGEGGLPATRWMHEKSWPIIEACAGPSSR